MARTIEIDAGKGRGRPRIRIGGRLVPWSLSIAHTGRGVLVAIADQGSISVGVDLVEPARLGRGFMAQWFTAAERRWLQPGDRAATAWGVKEAVYKAANRGEAFRPQSMEVFPSADGSFVCRSAATGKVVRDVWIWKTRHAETAVLAWVRKSAQ
jgi:phosphopantetheinyl transferase